MKRGAEDAAAGAPDDPDAAKRAALEGFDGQPAAAGGHEELDEELDDAGIPTGWRECPAMGRPIDRFIPMKVPLGARFDPFIEPRHRFTINDAVAAAAQAVHGITYEAYVPLQENDEPDPAAPPGMKRGRVQAVVGMVIDLTNSSRYYNPNDWMEHGIKYIKIPCRGRGMTPPPEAVTDLCWEMYMYLLQEIPHGMALIHCTHGFNRTGYMIASYLARMKSLNVPKALKLFTDVRPPGIYKHYYICDLFRYYHERLPSDFPFPPLPEWKAGDSPDRDDGLGDEEDGPPQHGMHHDDTFGEQVNLPEENMLRAKLMDAILGPDPHRNRVWLPGSQPVSLDALNKGLLEERQYWVTWKADGTRYMLVLLRWGTYLVDRKFAIRRVQMRWPTPLQPGQPAKAPTGPAHHWTVLDGEMVVDDIMEEDRQERRFLAYDMVMLNGQPIVDRPWMERYRLIQKSVIEPRQLERRKIDTRQWGYPYEYHKEAFHVRRKEFWPLTKAHSLIHKFIPQLCHEADGLIFQGAQDAYVPGTCQELLKWKFAHMNSVDFRLRRHPKHGWQLELLETRRDLSGMPEGWRRGYNALPGAQVEFPEGEDPELYDMRIIECSYDPQKQVWLYMRERKDKETPNAMHVYESVVRSIEDNIKEEELLQYIEQVLRLPLYDRDTGRTNGQQQQQPPPQQLPPPQQQQQQQQQQDGAP
ncbi:mRNA-capping enzyme isoform X1 [Micractinium conductrix]|uniref:mRNA guanylyltransferase n=1 Tax=Micractinium conductrix TaxID=554055 RepID=A0A2P6VDH5_9CHLO|nr:mRNA-capping enzyme isoform X1 [Micractinium conductrix]|eukprot:PSC72146.1 mRNA-capping enzyme isoform X1 [Micractinium conductrix]